MKWWLVSAIGCFALILGFLFYTQRVKIAQKLDRLERIARAMPKRNVFIIVNPISGGKDKEALVDAILAQLDAEHYAIQIHYTERGGHATELAQAAVQQKVDIVAVVGG